MQTITVEKGMTIIVKDGAIVKIAIPRYEDIDLDAMMAQRNMVFFHELPITIVDISEGMC